MWEHPDCCLAGWRLVQLVLLVPFSIVLFGDAMQISFNFPHGGVTQIGTSIHIIALMLLLFWRRTYFAIGHHGLADPMSI